MSFALDWPTPALSAQQSSFSASRPEPKWRSNRCEKGLQLMPKKGGVPDSPAAQQRFRSADGGDH